MTVLVFAPHPDDEVLGCGGTMARMAAEGNQVYVCIITRGKPPVYNHSGEILKSKPHDLVDEIEFAHRILGVSQTYFMQHPAVMLETVPRYELNQSFYDMINKVKPDVVYVPHYGDMQKDHEISSESIMVAVRPKGEHIVQKVYAYETMSETEWNIPCSKNVFIPNTYVNIDEYLSTKTEAMRCYQSQLADFPNPRSIDAITALARLRGSTMLCKAAEAFSLIREYRV